MGLVAQESALYADVWAVPAYSTHSPGASLAPLFVEMARIDPTTTRMLTVLDAGCGAGQGAVALTALGFRVAMVDVTDAGLVPEAKAIPFTEAALWDDLRIRGGYRFGGKVDYAYCTDVLEHIPPEFTMLVVQRLLDVARRGVFLSISLVPDQFGVWVGKSLHRSVRSFVAWRDDLATISRVVECRDLINCALYYLKPR